MSLKKFLNENVERVRQLLNAGLSDVEVCKELGLNWDEFWSIFEKIYKESQNELKINSQ